MGDILEDFKKYRDQFGLQSIYTNGTMGSPTDNGILFTVEYLICLSQNMPTSRDSSTKLLQEDDRISEVFKNCENLPGLLSRAPGRTDLDSMDNEGAALVWSAIGLDDFALANRIRNRGLNSVCNSVDPNSKALYWVNRTLNLLRKPINYWNRPQYDQFTTDSWFGRSPGFMGLVDIAATHKTTWFREISLFVGQFLGSFSSVSNYDARTLPYINWCLLRNRGPIWRLGYKLWGCILKKYYPNGMKDVYAGYYGSRHPLAVYSKTGF